MREYESKEDRHAQFLQDFLAAQISEICFQELRWMKRPTRQLKRWVEGPKDTVSYPVQSRGKLIMFPRKLRPWKARPDECH